MNWLLKGLLPVFLFTISFFSNGMERGNYSSSGALQLFLGGLKSENNVLPLLDEFSDYKFLSTTEYTSFCKKLVVKSEITELSNYPELCAKIGGIFQDRRDFQNAYYFYYITLKSEPELESTDKEYLKGFHELLAYVYYFYQRFNLAEKSLKQCLKFKDLDTVRRIKVLNTLSLIYRQQNKTKKSETFVREGLDLAIASNDEVWTGILSGNLGALLILNKEYKQARELTELDYNYSKKHKQVESELNALIMLIQIDLNEGLLTAAEEKINRYKSNPKYKGLGDENPGYYLALQKYYEEIGNTKESLASFKKYFEVKKEIDLTQSEFKLKNAEFQINFAEKQAQLDVLKEKKAKAEIRLYALSGVIFLVVLISYVFYTQQAKQRKKDIKIAELEKEKAKQELTIAEREMHAILLKMSEKNGMITQMSSEIERLNELSESRNSDTELLMDRLKSITLLTENDWVDFKNIFEKLNKGFFSFFQTNYPDITTAELRLAAMLKIDMSTHEMAATLGISPDSVRKTNLRLRKKVQIESQEDLISFIKKH